MARPRRHLRLRRAGARARTSGGSSPRPSPGASSSSRRNVEAPAQLRAADRGAARERRARRAGADRPGGRPGGAAARRRPGASGRRRSTSASACRTATLRARAMYLRYRLIAGELARGRASTSNCAPVLDVVRPETHAVIRNRCYGGDPAEVAAIGRAVAEGLLAGGRAAGDEAHARARAGRRSTATSTCRVVTADRRGAGGGLRAVPGAGRPADGDDRARRLCGARPRGAGDAVGARWCG